jgi:hypothetical protein
MTCEMNTWRVCCVPPRKLTPSAMQGVMATAREAGVQLPYEDFAVADWHDRGMILNKEGCMNPSQRTKSSGVNQRRMRATTAPFVDPSLGPRAPLPDFATFVKDHACPNACTSRPSCDSRWSQIVSYLSVHVALRAGLTLLPSNRICPPSFHI